MSKKYYKKVREKTYRLTDAQWEKVDAKNYELECGFGKIYLEYYPDSKIWMGCIYLNTFSSSSSNFSFDLRGYKVDKEFVDLDSQHKFKTKEAKLRATQKDAIKMAVKMARVEIENITEEATRAINFWRISIEELKEFE